MYRKENNKLIAEFMGLTKSGTMMTVDGSNMYNSREEEAYIYHGAKYGVDGLQYKYSWDWLMPVVEKIREIINVELTFAEFDDNRDYANKLNPFERNKEQVYKTVVEFIKWYNEKK